MIGEGDVLIICPSIHDVMATEKALRGEGIWCDLFPVPRELSAKCGMVVVVHEADLARIEPLLARTIPSWQVVRYPGR